MGQQDFFDGVDLTGGHWTHLGHGFFLELLVDEHKANLVRDRLVIKTVDLSDKVAKRIFVVEAVELGAMKSRLASALDMSRQTIDNYIETKKQFGLEGLIHSYNIAHSKSKRKQRELHSPALSQGHKAKQLAQIRQEEKEAREKTQLQFQFSFGADEQAQKVETVEQPFVEEHDWMAAGFPVNRRSGNGST